MTKSKAIRKDIIVFLVSILLFSIINLPQSVNDIDAFWNYNFILKINQSYIPYNDFNILIPPLFHWIGALLMNIIGNHFYMLAIYGGIICATIFIIFYKIINLNIKNTFTRVSLLSFSVALLLQVCTANYNIIMIPLILSIVYIEHKNANNQKARHSFLERNYLRITCTYQAFYWICFFFCIFYLLTFNRKKR